MATRPVDAAARPSRPPPELSAALREAASSRRKRGRLRQDRAVRQVVRVGGLGVILAITLIFVQLGAEVLPLFLPASGERTAVHAVEGAEAALHVAVEEQAELAELLAPDGTFRYFSLATGAVRAELPLPGLAGARVTAAAPLVPGEPRLAVGLEDGRVLFATPGYRHTYPDDRRVIVPELTLPHASDRDGSGLQVLAAGTPVRRLAAAVGDDRGVVVAGTGGRELTVLELAVTRSLLGDEASLEILARHSLATPAPARRLLVSPSGRHLYAVLADGALELHDLEGPPRRRARVEPPPDAAEVTEAVLLLGGVSLLVGRADGSVTQWLPVRGDGGAVSLQPVRSFDAGAPVRALATEHRRKGFAAAGGDGSLSVFHTTAERHLLSLGLGDAAPRAVAVAPRGDAAVVLDGAGRAHAVALDNEHPEVSLRSLWLPVWYENHEAPKLLWQSSASTSDVEPKFSLVPLSFGTLKAAFYAMLVAAPLAVLGAIYTAHFMHRDMRARMKPTVEVMEALPTVILGFLAGLWLAPFVERHLPGLLAMLLLVPLAMLLTGLLWRRAPGPWRHWVGRGWHALVLIPVVVAAAWLGLELSRPLELWLFAGDVRQWLAERGIDFDQRNAIVVGVAMGFAVIPTIFSIAEDAIFMVPRHLVHGSLALGASPWQTLVRVVLPTASPGIFSALMIGLGRAVGETMIVLMATGNTPVLDMSIFQGMRTLSANIAVEMPESEVDSTHYRILFLSALLLFLFTFLINTAADVVRQRLRRRYGTL